MTAKWSHQLWTEFKGNGNISGAFLSPFFFCPFATILYSLEPKVLFHPNGFAQAVFFVNQTVFIYPLASPYWICWILLGFQGLINLSNLFIISVEINSSVHYLTTSVTILCFYLYTSTLSILHCERVIWKISILPTRSELRARDQILLAFQNIIKPKQCLKYSFVC